MLLPEMEVKFMARKQKIETVSYVHVGDKLVNTDDLNDEQRRRLAKWLTITFLNTLLKGKAIIYCRDEKDCFPDCTVKLKCPHKGKGPGE